MMKPLSGRTGKGEQASLTIARGPKVSYQYITNSQDLREWLASYSEYDFMRIYSTW